MEKKLKPDEYYFNEQGLMVFTEKYHLRRGYCCGNKCKHCPYEYKNVNTDKENDKKDEEKPL